MRNQILHTVVGQKSYKKDEARFRRQRLATYLSKQDETKKLIWIYPDSRNKTTSYLKTNKINKKVLELSIPDPLSYNLSRSQPLDNIFITSSDEIFKKHRADKMILWYTHPSFPSLSSYKDLWDVVVYDCSDNWNKSWRKKNKKTLKDKCYFKLKLSIIRLAEKKILNNVDIVFASSKFLRKKMKNTTQAPVFLVENGVDFENFYSAKKPEKNEKLKEVPRPRLGFTGGMKLKIDFKLLNKVAEANPDWNIVLIGPKHTTTPDIFNKLVKKQNVYWIGEVEPSEVPIYLKELDVGLMPYKNIDYNKGVFPLKFYEYLASGLPVIGCGLPSTKDYVKDKIYLHTDNDADEFSEACFEALLWEEGGNMRKRIAKKADWNEKFRCMLEILLKKIS